MSKTLNITKNLIVPDTLAARTVFIAGTKGSGKTYTAGVLAEEMLKAHVHVVILDPLGVWWGLRHDAHGGPGGFPIIILGGEHADVPLLPSGGDAVAEFIVASSQPVILDMSGFDSDAEQDRFVEALLSRLFRLKTADKHNLHLIMDEADMFLPEQPMKGQERLVGAAKRIVTKGRSRGLSMTMITQRPQSIKKAAIEESDVVICHRMQGVNAIKAMRAWTDLYATAEQADTFYKSLPVLPDGESWIWSPRFLKAFGRHLIRRKETYDSSRTPDPGETVRKPKGAAAVDLARLTADIKASAEMVKRNDPRELHKRIVDLEKQLAARPTEQITKEVEKRVEVPVLKNGQLDRTEKIMGRVQELADKFLAETGELRRLIAPAATPVTRRPLPIPAPAPRPKPIIPHPQKTPKPKGEDDIPSDGSGITPRQQRFLDAAAALTTLGVEVSRGTVCGWVGVHPRGGSVGEELKALADAGLITVDRGKIVVTEAGDAAAEPIDPASAFDRAKSALSPRQTRIFEIIAGVHPESVTRDQVAEQMQIHARGGSFGEDISRLRGRGLIDSSRGVLRARDFLFAGMGQ